MSQRAISPKVEPLAIHLLLLEKARQVTAASKLSVRDNCTRSIVASTTDLRVVLLVCTTQWIATVEEETTDVRRIGGERLVKICADCTYDILGGRYLCWRWSSRTEESRPGSRNRQKLRGLHDGRAASVTLADTSLERMV